MPAIRISANNVEATLYPERGGLLGALSVNGSSQLYLPDDFSPDQSGWPSGGSPVLFPFAGRCFHEGMVLKYKLDGEVRNMPIHGFAYAKSFEITQQSDSEAILFIEDDESTRELYPFSFKLAIKYKIIDSGISITLNITNNGSEGMPIAAGLHPYFNFPSNRNSREDTTLETDACEAFHVTPAGAAGKSYHIAGPHILDAPKYDSLILGKMLSPTACLIDHVSNHKISLDWNNADKIQNLVLWSGDDFYCVEPWMGLPDAISTKAGLVMIGAGETFSQEIQITTG